MRYKMFTLREPAEQISSSADLLVFNPGAKDFLRLAVVTCG